MNDIGRAGDCKVISEGAGGVPGVLEAGCASHEAAHLTEQAARTSDFPSVSSGRPGNPRINCHQDHQVMARRMIGLNLLALF